MLACVGQKRHQDENYVSQLSLKKPNLDIKTCKTGVCVYVRCSSVRLTLSRLVDDKLIICGTLEILQWINPDQLIEKQYTIAILFVVESTSKPIIMTRKTHYQRNMKINQCIL